MKKLGYFYKDCLQKEFKKLIDEKNDFFIISYSGTKASDFSLLRNDLKQTGARALVLKNTLSKKALKENKVEGIDALIDGPTAFILGVDDPISVSKTLVEFNKKHETINLRGGFLESKVIDQEELKRISEIPPKEILYSMLCNCLESPIRGFVGALHNNLQKLVGVLNQITEKRR